MDDKLLDVARQKQANQEQSKICKGQHRFSLTKNFSVKL